MLPWKEAPCKVKNTEYYRELLKPVHELAHISIEIVKCIEWSGGENGILGIDRVSPEKQCDNFSVQDYLNGG